MQRERPCSFARTTWGPSAFIQTYLAALTSVRAGSFGNSWLESVVNRVVEVQDYFAAWRILSNVRAWYLTSPPGYKRNEAAIDLTQLRINSLRASPVAKRTNSVSVTTIQRMDMPLCCIHANKRSLTYLLYRSGTHPLIGEFASHIALSALSCLSRVGTQI